MWVWSLGWEDPLEKEMATHSSILAWRTPWTEEPGRQWSIGSQRVRHNWSDFKSMHIYLFIFLKNLATPHSMGTLVPWPGIESITSAVEAQSPNHWTTREFPFWLNFWFVNIQFCGLSFTFLMVPFEKLVFMLIKYQFISFFLCSFGWCFLKNVYLFFGCVGFRYIVQDLSLWCVGFVGCPEACGILVPWPEIEPASAVFQGGFLTIRLPQESLRLCFWCHI